MTEFQNNILGVILAGGQSRRFGDGDKFLKELGGKSLIEHVVEKAQKQTERVILNSNTPSEVLETFNLPIISDSIQGYAGPLAGILSGLEWAQENDSNLKWVASFPSDAPFIPADYIERLLAAVSLENADIACAVSGGRTHPVCALWRVELADNLRAVMMDENMRKIDLWTAHHHLVEVEFSDQPYDPFFNINRPVDLEQARQIVARSS